MTTITLTEVRLALVRLDLVHEFETSSHRKSYIEHIVIRAEAIDSTGRELVGWGECASPSSPFYCAETTQTCWDALGNFLVPMVLGAAWETPADAAHLTAKVAGNNFARAGLDMACWDLFAQAHGRQHGLTFIHPYDDPLVIAGQGTIALEMLQAVPVIDTLVVPVGGGGLISGMAVAAKGLKPDVRIIGVQAALYPSMYNAVKHQSLPMRGDTLAEGIAVKAPGRITTEIVERLVDDIVLVTEDELERAVSMLIAIEKTVVEGAGAAGLAAMLAHPQLFHGRNVGLVLCGGNIDTRLLASVLTRELAREGRLSQLAIDLVDRPGQLAAVATLLGEAGANIVEVSHQQTFSALPAKATLLEVVIETRDREHLDETVARMRGAGFHVEVQSNPGGRH